MLKVKVLPIDEKKMIAQKKEGESGENRFFINILGRERKETF